MTTKQTYSVWLGCYASNWSHCGYRVRGEHVETTSLRDARRLVRDSIGPGYVSVRVSDGIYCYRDRSAMDRDDDGSSAAAVISRPEVDQ